LVRLLQDMIGDQGGARMTGGGFGGCVVALAPKQRILSIQEMLRVNYKTPEDGEPRQWVCTPSSGVSKRRYF
jgi:galactokinase